VAKQKTEFQIFSLRSRRITLQGFAVKKPNTPADAGVFLQHSPA